MPCCPNCGHQFPDTGRDYLMKTNSDAPGLGGLLRGEGDLVMRAIARIGICVLLFLLLTFVFAGVFNG
jgi:hypothetical protein